MGSKVFLDANVCLDLLLKRENYLISGKVFSEILQGELKGYVSPAVVHITSYYGGRHHNKVIIRNILAEFLDIVNVIDCSHEIALDAVYSPILDLEDALQYYTALHHKLDYFLTYDKKLIKSSTVRLPICHPLEFIRS